MRLEFKLRFIVTPAAYLVRKCTECLETVLLCIFACRAQYLRSSLQRVDGDGRWVITLTIRSELKALTGQNYQRCGFGDVPNAASLSRRPVFVFRALCELRSRQCKRGQTSCALRTISL